MIDTQATPTPQKKWTLMFFFASDNAISPSTLPQLKAIEAAGPPVDSNVLVYFDPNEMGAPTKVFEINRNGGQTVSSDGEPVISVLSDDYISPEEIRRFPGPESQAFAGSFKSIDKLEAHAALEQFLGFCHENYPADHYMLFLVGHGLVVGRDAFLPDDNPESAIGLKTLGEILNRFKTKTGEDRLKLIGMHSCSMSAVEVAYELKGTASYMLASQGLSFVGSWPYRQLLMKIYNEAKQSGDMNVHELVKRLHALCIHYSVDFMHAGYSSDMSLFSLDAKRIRALTDPISKLSQALQDGMTNPRCRDLIVLAHWRSQSYWQETYTDLSDFCLCLTRLCKDPFTEPRRELSTEGRVSFDQVEADRKRIAIIQACATVINILRPENGNQIGAGPVVCADYVGPDVQYSHGLSIYFPWTNPPKDENNQVIKRYDGYLFTEELRAQQTWLTFLDTYFDKTKRPDRLSEEDRTTDLASKYLDPGYKTLIANLEQSFTAEVSVGSRDFFPVSVLEGKVSPPDSTGGACSCASTKNYSRKFSMSPGAATVFDNTKMKTDSASSSTGPTAQPGGSSQPSN
jgi:Clostripain family